MSITPTFEQYVCRIRGRRIVPIRHNDAATDHFRAPVTRNGEFKLYVVMQGKTFVYVGITRQPLASRLHVGFKPGSTRDYHGYPWKNLKKVDLFVWMSSKGKKRTESIEAELVFLIRQETRNWPTHQTEIHFHNPTGTTGSADRDTARRLFNALRRR